MTYTTILSFSYEGMSDKKKKIVYITIPALIVLILIKTNKRKLSQKKKKQ